MNNGMNHQAMMATTTANHTATANGDANANTSMMDSTTCIDATTSPTATSTTPIVSNHNHNMQLTQLLDLYVVQKCWFAGPHVKPAVDYRRLFLSIKDAEQVAYQSAHLFAKQKTVRTIQLQHGGYGFVASGTLFWVRRVRALSTNGDPRVGEAHAILTHGLVSSEGAAVEPRRVVQQQQQDSSAQPCVFVGPHSSHTALQFVTSSSSMEETPQRTVQWMPVGPPATVEQLACEWPDFAEWNNNNQHHRSHHNGNDNMMMMNDDSTSSKRDASENDPTLWFATASSETTAATAQPPPAKRACRPTTEDHARFFNEQIGVHGRNHEAASGAVRMDL